MFGKVSPAQNRLVEVRMVFWSPPEPPKLFLNHQTTIEKQTLMLLLVLLCFSAFWNPQGPKIVAIQTFLRQIWRYK